MPAQWTMNALRYISAVLTLIIATTALPANGQEGTEKTYRVELEARMTASENPIEYGLEWRIFKTDVDENGELPLLATANGGTKSFEMSAGEYFVHVAYGYAGVVRRMNVTASNNRQIFILNAGGLQLEAITRPDGPIASKLLRFDVYSDAVDERGIRRLIARDVRPKQIVPFAQGTYHVVSKYGKLNVETRADLRVQPGELTQATMQHRAARITLRLVRQSGGSAIADTSWSLLSEDGDVITESNSTFPSFVLSEGNYTAIARNSEKIYSRDFSVESSLNRDVEILIE
ncbi:MAG: hypothetical protein L3J32_06580 [Rhizobiaceae bacterium]|nr:hypothetical protein [Rhizobiaceae bacterium]